MKKDRIEKTLLAELQKTSNISIACERVGLSRQSIYRWMNEDLKFQKKVNEAIRMGVESINDLAESKLIAKIKEGEPRAVEYWLNSNKQKYMRPRPKEFWPHMFREDKVTQGGLLVIDTDGKIEYTPNKGQTKTLNINENDPLLDELVSKYGLSVIRFKNFDENSD